MEIQNTRNLNSILFFSGDFANDAAQDTENRNYGSYIEDYGYLRSTGDGGSYWTNYPDVIFREKTPSFYTLNDLYQEAYSYASRFVTDFPRGTIDINNNKYNANYHYENDLEAIFDNAKIYSKEDLKTFLLALNNQGFNKQNYYNGYPEISTIKIGQTYFDWHPKDSIGYYIGSYDATLTYDGSYSYFFYGNDASSELRYFPQSVDEVFEPMQGGPEDGPYLNKFTYEFTYEYDYHYQGDPYYLNGDYYSYLRHTYATIDATLTGLISDQLSQYETLYNNDSEIYAYHLYDCKADVELMLDSYTLGVKRSTFKIRFDSEFNSWFSYNIELKANVSTNDTICLVTSGQNGSIFSVIDTHDNRICGDNVTLNLGISHEFVSNTNIDTENSIFLLTPYKMQTLDLSPLKNKLSDVLDLDSSKWIENKGSMMEAFILGSEETGSSVKKINGLNNLTKLKYIDLTNVDSLETTPSMSNLVDLKVFEAKGSSIESFKPLKDAIFYKVSLPDTIKSLKLMGTSFVTGQLQINGESKLFDGTFDYTPNRTLNSLALKNIDNELSYRLFSEWHDSFESYDDELKQFNYLELTNILWENVPVSKLLGIKEFDVNPEISGIINIVGSGNYKWLSRDDYQSITKAFGYNVFTENVTTNKVFKKLKINATSKKETFEFSLKVENKNVTAFNEIETAYRETLTPDDLQVYLYDNYAAGQEKLIYPSVLDVKIGDINPYGNRAANALLDIIYHKNTEFTFKVDELNKCATCKLDNSLDTSNSEEIHTIKAGDIMLFNGDTLMIFFENKTNTLYEYIKLGEISTETVRGFYDDNYSANEHWFDSYLRNDGEITLDFIKSEREVVIQELFLEELSEDKNVLFDNNLEGLHIKLDIDEFAKANMDSIANKQIHIEYDSSVLTVEEVSNTEENEYPKEYVIKARGRINEAADYDINFWCDANKVDTLKTYTVKLRVKYSPSYFEAPDTLVLNRYHTIEGDTIVISAESTAHVDGDILTIN